MGLLYLYFCVAKWLRVPLRKLRLLMADANKDELALGLIFVKLASDYLTIWLLK